MLATPTITINQDYPIHMKQRYTGHIHILILMFNVRRLEIPRVKKRIEK